MSHHYRPLLPAALDESQQGREQAVFNPGADYPLQKRVNISAACEACRKRKSKCTAERPRCAICVDKGTVCEYRTLPSETHSHAQKRRITDLEFKCETYDELYQVLRTRSEVEVYQILQRIRSGADIFSVIKLVRDGDLLLDLFMRPEIRFRYEFPYRRQMPRYLGKDEGGSNNNDDDDDNDDNTTNPYLNSILYQVIHDGPESAAKLEDVSGTPRDVYRAPFLGIEVLDPRLSGVRATRWTCVSCENSLVQILLQIYLSYEFSFLPFFQKDAFLDDMRDGTGQFCSPALFNALLAAAWHGYTRSSGRADSWNPDNPGYKFLAEAKRLTEVELERPKITTIQALCIISVTCNANGNGRVAWIYLERALKSASKLGLFLKLEEYKTTMDKVKAVTAWNLYNWQAFACFHNFRAPLLKNPPQCPLPRTSEVAEYYGEVWVGYPSTKDPVSLSSGPTTKAVSELSIIINDLASTFFGPGARHLSPETALGFGTRLFAWYRSLPEPLTAKKAVLPSHLKLHMHYHAVLISLFSPFKGVAVDGTPEDSGRLVHNSQVCLETLIRVYYQRHSFEAYDVTMWQYLALLGFTIIGELRDRDEGDDSADADDLRSTLILCARGLSDQGRSCYMSEAVFRLLRGEMRPGDAKLTSEFAQMQEDGRNTLVTKQVRSDWPITTFDISRNPREHSASALLKSWKERRQEVDSDVGSPLSLEEMSLTPDV